MEQEKQFVYLDGLSFQLERRALLELLPPAEAAAGDGDVAGWVLCGTLALPTATDGALALAVGGEVGVADP